MEYINCTNIKRLIQEAYFKCNKEDLNNMYIAMDEDTELIYRFYCSEISPSIHLPLNWAGYKIVIDNTVKGFEFKKDNK